ncbi:hypothetical protein EDC01DRAFT_791251 [Geopyxis carbonaria]|nr:hypothetical protein EDC01DRAFT_791251 [Geopyxis carbonaria]
MVLAVARAAASSLDPDFRNPPCLYRSNIHYWLPDDSVLASTLAVDNPAIAAVGAGALPLYLHDYISGQFKCLRKKQTLYFDGVGLDCFSDRGVEKCAKCRGKPQLKVKTVAVKEHVNRARLLGRRPRRDYHTQPLVFDAVKTPCAVLYRAWMQQCAQNWELGRKCLDFLKERCGHCIGANRSPVSEQGPLGGMAGAAVSHKAGQARVCLIQEVSRQRDEWLASWSSNAREYAACHLCMLPQDLCLAGTGCEQCKAGEPGACLSPGKGACENDCPWELVMVETVWAYLTSVDEGGTPC